MPRGLDSVASINLATVLSNAIAQTADFRNMPGGSLPPVWHCVLWCLHDKRNQYTIRNNAEVLRGNLLSAPLLATSGVVIKKAHQWKLLGNALALLAGIEEFQPAFTIADMPSIIAALSSPQIPRATPATRNELEAILKARYNTDYATAHLLVSNSRQHPYYFNWDYGLPDGSGRSLAYSRWLNLCET
ncbi:hypothetical protein COEREDRAFT_9226 [Coemansia reversa NRRL 1564]|uniref:Uncharacterized protein n=1 Tax=Coemansia reversa (strain ATCC 12441 / NRRL 1564) TaxID=763665 RepID=A0A2G5B921_COERN|nr:hypothetical protein COEREDRAFT_9226 [Coemansia reversa NRRL 1564]|eukprot:PIA15508.1 hypothetical protein COEREDRAFT_9226 [Coemansia reversa NRRL 1564]